jgi:uncharacterized BrkB/YihY/UPF0761 family membrane protein
MEYIKLKVLLKDLYRRFFRDEIVSMGAEISFCFLFSLSPFLIF